MDNLASSFGFYICCDYGFTSVVFLYHFALSSENFEIMFGTGGMETMK